MARQLKLKAKELKYYNGEYTIPEICKLTNKTNSQVKYYLEKYSDLLGLKVAKRKLKSERIKELLENGRSPKEIALIADTTINKVSIFLDGAYYRENNFTQDEIDYIAKFYGTISQRKMAEKLGRPYQTVKMKVYEMRKRGDIVDGNTVETNKPRKVFGGFNVNKYMRERKK